MQSNDRHRVYKRLETDAEFVARIHEKFPWWKPCTNTVLDNVVWTELKMQRRIIEDTTDRPKPSQESLPAARDARSAKR